MTDTLEFKASDLRISVLPQNQNFLVFSDGRIYSLRYQKFIRTSVDTKGYPRFTVKAGNKTINRRVHKSVAEAFLGPCPPKMECAHLDGNRLNADVSNLKYVTRKENHSHKKEHGTHQEKEKHPNAKLTADDVAYIRAHYRKQSPNKSNAGELAKRFGVTRNYIGHIIRGYNWSDRPRPRPNESDRPRIISIEPLKKDTHESLLREWFDMIKSAHALPPDLVTRTERVLKYNDDN